ncbi:GNAT family N-acetyltransferase [Rhodanobacter fulvus]|uniref:GNAT family N-acetyltransferase n=1 Tax=Rhodanobacter fulvus TaxID=219571 RepID=UPI00031BDA39|nr:GNAT family N-acetyltransferase [Rhodanobacter fulvus]
MSNSVAASMADRLVELRIPANLPYQLIYRMHRTALFDAPARDDVEFRFVSSLPQLLPLALPLRRVVTTSEWVKSLVRINVGGRMFYCLLRDGVILHRGWVSVSFCNHYKVGPGDVVIGPIWSAPGTRGQGLAKYATQRAINELIGRGLSTFYIDTSADNLACQKMIANCDFGSAMGCTPRLPE